MKCMLLMTRVKADFEAYAKWARRDHETHHEFMRALSRELKAEGSFVATEGLAWPNEAVTVRGAADGTPITGGVFPESKEFPAGYWMIDVQSPEGAYRIATRLSAQPSPGGVASAPIEVRRILTGPPEITP